MVAGDGELFVRVSLHVRVAVTLANLGRPHNALASGFDSAPLAGPLCEYPVGSQAGCCRGGPALIAHARGPTQPTTRERMRQDLQPSRGCPRIARMLERVLRVAHGWREAEELDRDDLGRLSVEERISAVAELRRAWFGEDRLRSRLVRVLVAGGTSW